MRTNIQLDHSQFITTLEPYQEKPQGQIDYVQVDRLVNFASVFQPDLPRNKSARVRLYANRIEVKVNGYPPLKALQTLRGVVSLEFSRRSRRRFMNAAHSWQCPPDYKRYHIILTYPRDFPEDWHIWKDHLKAFKRKLMAVFGDLIQGYWRLELQKRGAPHYHLVVALPKGFVTNKKLKRLITQWWASIAHTTDQYQGKYATQVRVLHNDDMALHYIQKYCAKIPDKQVTMETRESLDLRDQFEQEAARFRDNQLQQKSIGRHWGRVGKPNEEPLLELSAESSAQSYLRANLTAWVRNLNEWYADKIENKPDYISYQVYGVRAYEFILDHPPLCDYLIKNNLMPFIT